MTPCNVLLLQETLSLSSHTLSVPGSPSLSSVAFRLTNSSMVFHTGEERRANGYKEVDGEDEDEALWTLNVLYKIDS